MSKELKNLSEDIKRYEPIIALDGEMMGLTLSGKLSTNLKKYLKDKWNTRLRNWTWAI